jgi:hypothetical protein
MSSIVGAAFERPRRILRTVARLHPLQVASRVPAAFRQRLVADVPGGMGPQVLLEWPPPSEALRRLRLAERARSARRLARLPAGSELRAYEAHYGLELGPDEAVPAGDWTSPIAVRTYPAAVRARSIAVATRCGRRGLERELARAARAVLLLPEVHLLGNHLLENGFGLVCAGAAARGIEADLWWAAGNRLLEWQLPAQFLADGGHVERSASYHVALAAALLESVEIARASGRGVPPLWLETASRALGWAEAVRAPDGTYPLFNDSALDAAPTLDDLFAFAAACDVSPAPVGRVVGDERARIMHLTSTGWLRLEAGRAYAVVDAGPDAEGWQPGHAHADGLTFELWIDGVRTVVDFGVETYASGRAREETRATRSHNTVELDGRDSCEVWAAFRVGRRGRGKVLASEVEAGVARIELEHDGYAWLPDEPRHRRTLMLGEHGLEVRDRVVGGAGRWCSRVRLDAQARARVSGEGELHERADRWHPRHGEPSPARVLEQRARAGDARGVVWRIEW